MAYITISANMNPMRTEEERFVSDNFARLHSILVVDDDPGICLLNSEVLTRVGYHVDSVKDVKSAFQAMQMVRYDLLILDNQMPGESGVDLLKTLQALKYSVPVIMATGSVPSREFEKDPSLKPALVLLKPYTLDDLLQAVKCVLTKLNYTTQMRPAVQSSSPQNLSAG